MLFALLPVIGYVLHVRRSGNGGATHEYKILVLGQVISFLLSSAGAAQATLHFNCNLSVPTLSTAFVYFLLSLCIIPFYCQQRRLQKLGMKNSVVLKDDDDTSASTHSNNSDDGNGLHGDEEDDGEDFNRYEKNNINGNNDNNKDNDTIDHSDASTVVGNLSSTKTIISTTSDDNVTMPPYSFLGIVPLNSPMWAYALIALLDVEANYVTVLAFQYTTLTSVNLFDALAIPAAMILSRLFLNRSYVSVHMIGATICMVGIVMNVFTDYESAKEGKEQDEFPYRGVGDMLAILGGVLRGCNNVVQEYAIQNSGIPTEYLGMLGLFGTLLSIIQIAALERDDVAELFGLVNDEGTTCSTEDNVLLVVAYVICLGAVYVGGAYFLLYSEAALYNLSLLTCDLWTVIFSVVAEQIIPPPLFFAALLLIVGGVVLYETGPSPIVTATSNHDGDDSRPTAMLATNRRFDMLDMELGDPSNESRSDDNDKDDDDDEEGESSQIKCRASSNAHEQEGMELVICQAAEI